MSVVDKIKELNGKMAKLEKERKALFQESLKETFDEIFKEHPKLLSIRWQGYTPYFNDGDPCVYTIYDFYAEVEGIKSWVHDYSKYGGRVDSGSEYNTADEAYKNERCLEECFLATWDKECPEEIKEVLSSLGSLPDDLFLQAFGDHAEITATREGFKVEAYDHE